MSDVTLKERIYKDEDGNPIPATLQDGDTLTGKQGVPIRLSGGMDTAEVTKLSKGGNAFAAGSLLGNAQTKAVESILDYYPLLPNFKKGAAAFNRDLATPTSLSGDTLPRDTIVHGITEANAFTPSSDVDTRTLNEAYRLLNPNRVPTQFDKARDIVDAAKGSTPLIVRPQANNVEEFQNYTAATSYKGIQAQEDYIADLKKRLLSPKINPAQRMSVQRTLDGALNSLQYNIDTPMNLYNGSVEGNQIRGAFSVLGEFERAAGQGWNAVKENAANMKEYLGDVFDSESTIREAKDYKKELGRELRRIDLKAGDVDITGGTVTNLDRVVDDPTKLFRFIGSTILTQGPLMASMVGTSVAGGALGTLVGGPVGGAMGAFAGPMAVGVADVYGEMPEDEKNVLVAGAVGSAIGVVDRFGFAKGSVRAIDLVTKEGREKVIDKIAHLKATSAGSITAADRVAAGKLLDTELRNIGKDYATIVGAVATNQLIARKGIADLITQISGRFGKEAATETLQDAMQVLGIASFTSVDVDYEKLYKRMKESAVAGGILGAASGVYSAPREISEINQELNILSGVETDKRTDNSLMAQEEIKRNGKMLSDIELAANLNLAAIPDSQDSTGTNKPLSSLVIPGDKPSMVGDLGHLVTHGGLLSQSRDNAIGAVTQFQGGRELGGLLDAKSVRGVYAGLSAFKRIHMIANSVMSKLPTLSEKRDMFGTDNSKDIGTALLQSVRGATNTPGSTLYRQRLDKMGEELADHLSTLPARGGWSSIDVAQPDFFIRNQVVDPILVRANQAEFTDEMMRAWTVSAQQYNPFGSLAPDPLRFRDLTNRIMENMTYREIQELKEIGALDNPVFDKFKSKDVEKNAVRLVEAITRSAIRNSIFGKQGEILAKPIYRMLAAGEITKEQASKLAVDMQQQIDMFDGRLNRVDNPLARAVQENLTFISMMSYMDTSLFANLGEVVYGSLGLDPKQIVKYFGKTAKIAAADMVSKLTQLGSYITNGKIKGISEVDMSKDMKAIGDTGHYGHMNDIAFNIGANISTQSKRNMSRIMFKVNLVESATNAARAARASFAADEFNNLVSIIAESPTQNNITRWARDRLQYYRIDPDELLQLYIDLGESSITTEALNNLSPGDPLVMRAKDIIRVGTINFVDEFSSRPEPGSAPKLLEDHRFALFTQFKRFTYHFSSNVVPQLWAMYVKRGDTRYTYSAFNVAMLAFAISYLGMYLKAALRGEDEKDDEKVYRKRMEQAFNYSWGQAPADLYNMSKTVTDIKNPSMIGGAVDTVVKLSPALGLANSIRRDGYKVLAGEDSGGDAKQKLVNRVPILGEIPAVRTHFNKE